MEKHYELLESLAAAQMACSWRAAWPNPPARGWRVERRVCPSMWWSWGISWVTYSKTKKMPHVVLERIRNAPFRHVEKDSGDRRSRLDVRAAYMIEGLELGANLMFVVGSGCFLPAYAHDMDVFLMGCGLFVFGSFVYCCITFYTLCEVPVVCIVGTLFIFFSLNLPVWSYSKLNRFRMGLTLRVFLLRRCTIMTTSWTLNRSNTCSTCWGPCCTWLARWCTGHPRLTVTTWHGWQSTCLWEFISTSSARNLKAGGPSTRWPDQSKGWSKMGWAGNLIWTCWGNARCRLQMFTMQILRR